LLSKEKIEDVMDLGEKIKIEENKEEET